ncbi:MAG: trypsin-like peptidase domain-containing protein [Clostridia bacterium]|nr:trypsin-like peptidase domain-containing protein [Clostridia bacterium]
MKTLKKLFAIAIAVVMTVVLLAIPASAKTTIEDYQNSVVFVGATVQFEAANYNHVFTDSWSGTGFAVGLPGEKVQYIATCSHVVSAPSGIYTLYVDIETGELLHYEQESEGTHYPAIYQTDIDGIGCEIIRDYFNTETVDLYALFSNASNDYINLTVSQNNEDVDIALCKLSSDPTDKISALPIQVKETIEIGDEVYALGYPSTSRYFNYENRLDSKDSTVKNGIISKFQNTTGMTGTKTPFESYETTAELITGMSGGPLISKETGAVVGINAFLVADSSQAASARYAVVVDYLVKMLDSEGISYKQIGSDGGISPVIIIGAIIALVLIAGVVIIVLVLSKSKKTPVVTPVVHDGGDVTVNPVKKYYLLGVSGPLAGRKFGITSSAVIGRDKTKCNVLFPIDQPGVSGLHCEVKISGSILTLTDCNSSYGTFLENGTKLSANAPVVLNSGMKFWVGSRDNVFEVKY